MDGLTKQLAKATDSRNRDFARLGRRSFGKVCEVQARGLVHYHSIIRLDGFDPTNPGAVVAPGAWASVEVLEGAIRAAVARAAVMAADGREIRWGEQVDIRPIDTFGADESLSDEAVAGYVAKYATRSAECTGTVDSPVLCRPARVPAGSSSHPWIRPVRRGVLSASGARAPASDNRSTRCLCRSTPDE
jgi:hypothetical protein